MKAKPSVITNSISRSRLRRGLLLTSLALALMGGVLARSTNAAFPGQNGKIAFYRLLGGTVAIFTINPDGSGLTRLTSTLANNTSQPGQLTAARSCSRVTATATKRYTR